MNNDKTSWYASRNFDCWCVDLFVSLSNPTGRLVADPIYFTMSEHKPGIMRKPTFQLEMDEAQKLMQSLWEAGIRPNHGEGASGHLDSVKYHLEDMRKLVFNPLTLIHNTQGNSPL